MAGIIAVYGSARPLAGEIMYEEACKVGAALASAGYTVMTGGYDGVMAGISQGAHDVGGHVIGITVRELELVGERIVNKWVKEEIKYETLRERLYHLSYHPDGYVAMPGGVGTIQEVTEVWQMMRMKAIPARPFVLYGTFWQPLLDMLVNSPFVGASEMSMVQQAYTPEAMMQILTTWRGNGKA
jgi:uncharacterized protein (TIGR00730 family)